MFRFWREQKQKNKSKKNKKNYWDMPDHKEQMGAIYDEMQFGPFLYHVHFLAIMSVCVVVVVRSSSSSSK